MRVLLTNLQTIHQIYHKVHSCSVLIWKLLLWATCAWCFCLGAGASYLERLTWSVTESFNCTTQRTWRLIQVRLTRQHSTTTIFIFSSCAVAYLGALTTCKSISCTWVASQGACPEQHSKLAKSHSSLFFGVCFGRWTPACAFTSSLKSCQTVFPVKLRHEYAVSVADALTHVSGSRLSFVFCSFYLVITASSASQLVRQKAQWNYVTLAQCIFSQPGRRLFWRRTSGAGCSV